MTAKSRIAERLQRMVNAAGGLDRIFGVIADNEVPSFEFGLPAPGIRAMLDDATYLDVAATHVEKDLLRYVDAFLVNQKHRDVVVHRLLDEWPLAPEMRTLAGYHIHGLTSPTSFEELEEEPLPTTLSDEDHWCRLERAAKRLEASTGTPAVPHFTGDSFLIVTDPIPHLLWRLGKDEKRWPHWPLDVNAKDLVAALERTKDPDALVVADVIQNPPPKHEWLQPRPDDSGRLDLVPPPEEVQEDIDRFVHTFESQERWSLTRCALVVSVERLFLEARSHFVRAPTQIIQSFIAGRSEDFTMGARFRLDQSGRTFTAPARDGIAQWRFDPPSGLQLSLPLDSRLARSNPFAAARETLGPNVLRIYLADWYLVGEQGRSTGIHTVDPAHMLHDLLGYKPAKTTVRGKQYDRINPKNQRVLDGSYDVISSTYLLGIGDTDFKPPEQLLRRVELTHRPSGAKGEAYVPCVFAMEAFTSRFMQLPLQALRLPANRTEMAMGIGAGLKETAQRWHQAGHLSLSAQQWAQLVGEPIGAKTRKYGRRYWTDFSNTLATVAHDGAFGTMHVGNGDGADVILTLEVSDDLGLVYTGLINAHEKRKALASQVKFEAEVRQLESEKRKRGRPRKPRKK